MKIKSQGKKGVRLSVTKGIAKIGYEGSDEQFEAFFSEILGFKVMCPWCRGTVCSHDFNYHALSDHHVFDREIHTKIRTELHLVTRGAEKRGSAELSKPQGSEIAELRLPSLPEGAIEFPAKSRVAFYAPASAASMPKVPKRQTSTKHRKPKRSANLKSSWSKTTQYKASSHLLIYSGAVDTNRRRH